MSFFVPRPAPTQFRVLTVCTGNICRSPLAELHLRRGLDGLDGVSVASAGTMAVEGDPMPEQARALAQSFGLEPDAHRARFLTEGEVSGSGLVIALAREHRRSVVSLHPRASRYTFTLREAARLARDVSDDDLDRSAVGAGASVPERLQAGVQLLASRRGPGEAPDDPLDDDVVDPYRRSDEVFEESGRQLVPAADTLVGLLRRAATRGGDDR